MQSDKLFHLLDLAPYGAYAVDMGQTILFWNRTAERILGHRSEDVIGLRCYEVCKSLTKQGSVPVCMEGCPSITLARQETTPPVFYVRMLCASGMRKPVTVTPMIIPVGEGDDTVLLLHLFHESDYDALVIEAAEDLMDALSEAATVPLAQWGSDAESQYDDTQTLTSRELEVLRLVAQSFDTGQIADQLHLSAHTVLNHIRNARLKLNAPNRLSAVLAAQRRGLI